MGQAGQAIEERSADDAVARGERFRTLVLPHLDAAYNLARWLSGNAGDADDVVRTRACAHCASSIRVVATTPGHGC